MNEKPELLLDPQNEDPEVEIMESPIPPQEPVDLKFRWQGAEEKFKAENEAAKEAAEAKRKSTLAAREALSKAKLAAKGIDRNEGIAA